MARVTIRLEDDVSELIDRLAKAAGLTRSAWITRAIKDALPARPDEVRNMPMHERGPSMMLALRFPAEDIAAMDHVATRAGMTRSQWVKRALRWQLWDRAGELRLVPASHRAIIKLVAQVREIGRSLNQSVKAMNAANKPESPIEIQRVAAELVKMEQHLSGIIRGATAELATAVSGEVDYWTMGARIVPKRIAVSIVDEDDIEP